MIRKDNRLLLRIMSSAHVSLSQEGEIRAKTDFGVVPIRAVVPEFVRVPDDVRLDRDLPEDVIGG